MALLNFPLVCCSCLALYLVGKFWSAQASVKNVPVTFADVAGDAADISVDHLLVELLDVEGLDGEGQHSGQHGKGAHASVPEDQGKHSRWEWQDCAIKRNAIGSLTQTRRPLWVRTSCEPAARGLRRRDCRTGCWGVPGTETQSSECCSGQSLRKTSVVFLFFFFLFLLFQQQDLEKLALILRVSRRLVKLSESSWTCPHTHNLDVVVFVQQEVFNL